MFSKSYYPYFLGSQKIFPSSPMLDKESMVFYKVGVDILWVFWSSLMEM